MSWTERLGGLVGSFVAVIVAMFVALFLYLVLAPTGVNGFDSVLTAVAQTYGNNTLAYTYFGQAKATYMNLGQFIGVAFVLAVISPFAGMFIAEKTGKSYNVKNVKILQYLLVAVIGATIIAIILSALLPTVVTSAYQSNMAVDTLNQIALTVYIVYVFLEVAMVLLAVAPVLAAAFSREGEGVLIPQA
ncbi:MAG: hypothetical protein ACP5IB_06635 [Thermoplasmata archaeon]